MSARARPIPFSAPMVRALLAGKKTQTRRILEPQPPEGTDALISIPGEDRWFSVFDATEPVTSDLQRELASEAIALRVPFWRCPYGKPGDLLWVREPWRTSHVHERLKPSEIPVGDPVAYYADGECYLAGRYRHARFMPRWVSRITLRITDVRVERLQQISEADAIAEGICYVGKTVNGTPMWAQFAAIENTSAGLCADVKYIGRTAAQAYERLWESINGAGSWAANPWVWAVSFEVITRNVEHVTAAA